MSLLRTFGPAEASGETKEIYQSFLKTVGMVPPPFILMSASPAIQSLQARLIGYYREESNLSPMLLALIRYLTAIALEMEPCVEFNAKALTALGLTGEKVREIGMNPAAAPLDEKEGWLLAFVIKSVRTPDSVSENHIKMLHDLGWSDNDIFDALYMSCMMLGMDRLMKALRFGEPHDGTAERQGD